MWRRMTKKGPKIEEVPLKLSSALDIQKSTDSKEQNWKK
jgi:hypothetical protein